MANMRGAIILGHQCSVEGSNYTALLDASSRLIFWNVGHLYTSAGRPLWEELSRLVVNNIPCCMQMEEGDISKVLLDAECGKK